MGHVRRPGVTRRPAGPRTHRGQYLSGTSPRRGAPAHLRRPGRRPGPDGGGAHRRGRGRRTRCTRTSCDRATRGSRSSTRSTGSATVAASRRVASSPSNTAAPSTTCRPVSIPKRTGSTTSSRCPTCPAPRPLDGSSTGFKTRGATSRSGSSATTRSINASSASSRGVRTGAASRDNGCGSGPTASCPTTRCCTRASSPTPVT